MSPARKLRPGAWRDGVRDRWERLSTQVNALKTAQEIRPGWDNDLKREVEDPLAEVRERVEAPTDLSDRVSGTPIEAAWRQLRKAEEGLLLVCNDAALKPYAEAALAHGANLGADHERVRSLDECLKEQNPDAKVMRASALSVLRLSHEKSDAQHRRIRSFRIQLLIVVVALVLLALILLLAQLVMDSPIIPEPSAGDAESVSDGSGGLVATGTLAYVFFFGMLGALVSALPSLAQFPESDSPFNFSRQQAGLKVASGAWSAVIGVLVVNSGLVSTQTAATSFGRLAILAALFGAGQEAVTRFADRKASDLLSST